MVNQESAVAYKYMYESMEAGVLQLVLCLAMPATMQANVNVQRSPGAGRAGTNESRTDSAKEEEGQGQAEKEEILASPGSSLVLQCCHIFKIHHQVETTFDSMSKKIFLCTAHLAGIAWQKKAHFKYCDLR